MPTDEESIFDLLEREIRGRLTDDQCPACGRGGEKLGDTALSQMFRDIQRLEIAKAKMEEDVQEKAEVNPFALLATAGKLPADNPTRKAILDRVEGEALALTRAVEKMKAE